MGWSNAVITNGGLALIAQAVSGETMSIISAGLGGGTVDTAALMAQTALTSPLAVSAVISAKGELENGISVQVQIRNTGVTAVQHMKQVGLFAQIGDNSPVLFAIMQCDNNVGEEIPPQTEYPDFMIEFTAAVAVSNTDNIVVTISTSAVITRGALEEELQNYTTNKSFNSLSESVDNLSKNKADKDEVARELAKKANTDDVNTALSEKAPTQHQHTQNDISDFPTSFPANGGDANTVNGYSVNSDVPANAKFTDTTYTNMTGATASAAGKAGLVPAPAKGAATRFLRSDGSWQVPPNTTYGAASPTANGLMTTGAQTLAGNKTFNGQVIPAGASAFGTPQARKLSSGTAAANNTNCPAGAWYGQHG